MLSDSQQRITILRALPNDLFEDNYLILGIYIYRKLGTGQSGSRLSINRHENRCFMEVRYGYTTWYKG